MLGFSNKEPKSLFEANVLVETCVLNRHRISLNYVPMDYGKLGSWASDAFALETVEMFFRSRLFYTEFKGKSLYSTADLKD